MRQSSQGHAEVMQEAGAGGRPHRSAGWGATPLAMVFRLTWAGHAFLAATRNDTIWAKTKHLVRERAGEVPFEIFKMLAIKLVAVQWG